MTELFYGVAGWNCGMWLAFSVPTGVFMNLSDYDSWEFFLWRVWLWNVVPLGCRSIRYCWFWSEQLVQLAESLKQFSVIAGQ